MTSLARSCGFMQGCVRAAIGSVLAHLAATARQRQRNIIPPFAISMSVLAPGNSCRDDHKCLNEDMA